MIGSLFSGIGGLELGLEWAGLGPVAWQVEQDDFCRRVLARHWPNADRSVTDVRQANARNLIPVDLLCGGFPCQDVALHGSGVGLDGERSGLWSEFLRIVRELRPDLVVVENVSALLIRGLDRLLGNLAESGYDAFWRCLRAADVGAPHGRTRIFVVAYAQRAGLDKFGPDDLRSIAALEEQRWNDAYRRRTSRGGGPALEHVGAAVGWPGLDQPGLGRRVDGLSDRLDAARWPAPFGSEPHGWEPPRMIRALSTEATNRQSANGNAVSPWCSYRVGLFVSVLREVLYGH